MLIYAGSIFYIGKVLGIKRCILPELSGDMNEKSHANCSYSCQLPLIYTKFIQSNIMTKTVQLIAGILLIFTLSSCGVLSGIFTEKISKKAMVAYYPFNGNAADESGNGNNGASYGAMLTSDRSGEKNSAYAFDGIADYILVSDSEMLRLTESLSVSLWFKTGYALPFAGIICKSPANEPRGGYLLAIDNYDKLRADVMYDHSRGLFGTLVSENVLTDNEWHHAVATYDGETFRLFIDGMLVDESLYGEGIKPNSEPLMIGWDRSRWLSHRHFKGSIDDIRIYSRPISLKEIQSLYKE
jgi:hypothetical protein